MPSNKLQSGNLKPLLLILAAVAVVFIILFIYEDNFKAAVGKSAATVLKDPQVQMLNSQSQSDDVESIGNDLDNTKLDNIDQGTTQINQNLTNLPN